MPQYQPPTDLRALLASRLVGQTAAIDAIVPCVQMYQAGLSPSCRPAGVFLLLGPSGTGKTRTVEALSAALHGNESSALRIDCGEFQMEHEVAKLIGAPPGYLGHKETQPLLTQANIDAVASEKSNLSLILFDEIEKAAPSLHRLLLGVLDKGTLRLGDNSVANFERSLIFFTSNLGSSEMMSEIAPEFGFQSVNAAGTEESNRKLDKIGRLAVRRRFSPEFVNRIDAVVTYHPLDQETLDAILTHQLLELNLHIRSRLGLAAFRVEVTNETRAFLLEKGTSVRYGARELKRTIHQHITQPVAAMVVNRNVEPGSMLVVDCGEGGLTIEPFHPAAPRQRRASKRAEIAP